MTEKKEPKLQDCVEFVHEGVLQVSFPRNYQIQYVRTKTQDADKTNILPSSGVSQLPVDRVKDCAK
jgi:hypothetical protein